MRLKNRIAVITGASRGIGRQVALSYAEEGADLILLARDAKALEETENSIRNLGRRAVSIAVDLADPRSLESVVAAVREFDRLDILVGNAAILGPMKPVVEIAPTDWQELWVVNVLANIHLLRLLHPYLAKSDAGRAIFVTSYGATMNLPQLGGYGLSKAALESVVKTYAVENAATPIRANLLNPGGIRTDMRRAFMPNEEDPMKLPTAADVAPLFVELALPSCKENGTVVAFPEWKVKGK